jgi:hypothetical protein
MSQSYYYITFSVFFNARIDIINSEINNETEQIIVMPCHPYERQTGPKRIEERLPPKCKEIKRFLWTVLAHSVP